MPISSPASVSHKHPPPEAVGLRRRRWWIIGSAAAGATTFAIFFIWFALSGNSEPRLNAATAVLAKFVMSKDFEAMPFEKQRLYYKVLDDRSKEIDAAFKEGRLREDEY